MEREAIFQSRGENITLSVCNVFNIGASSFRFPSFISSHPSPFP